MKTIFLAGILLIVATPLFAQLEGSAFTETGRGASNAFVTDYQALGINPANIALGNEYNKKFTFSIGQFALSDYAEGFTKKQLSNAIFGVDDDLTEAERFQAAEDFTNTKLSIDANTTLFGFAVNTQKAGSFAFGVNFVASHYSVFNETGASQLWTGFVDPYFDQWVVEDEFGQRDTIANAGPGSDRIDDVLLGIASDPLYASQLYDGTVVRALSYMSYSFGYGRNVFENDDVSVFAGVGVKYLQGLYVLNVTVEDNEVKEAYTASTPGLGIDYGSSALTNPSALTGGGFQSIGDGFGFDFGVTVELNDQLRIAASVTDIGSITYDGNVYTSRDTLVNDIATNGIESYNLFAEFDAFAGQDGLFQWDGEKETKVNLPTKARLGIGYFYNEKLRLGLDLAFPLNEEPGNIETVSFAAGAEFIPTPVVHIQAGIGAGDNYQFRIPVGFVFVIGDGLWELGVASRDILYFFKEDEPNLSVAAGFMRFRFGEMDKGNQSRMF